MRLLTRSRFYLQYSLFVVLYSLPLSQLLAASEYDSQFINAELERAITQPDNSVSISVEQPIQLVFDALLTQLAEFSEDIAEISFEAGNPDEPEELGVGSLRMTTMTDGRQLAQRIIVYEPPHSFAYFTDMSLSTVSVPIDYLIGHYTFSEQPNGSVDAKVSIAYQPSSRLTSIIVRLGFSRTLARDFQRAEEYLNALPRAE